MKTKTLLASAALASLVLVQPVAAATRSGDSLPTTRSTVSIDRVDSLSGESDAIKGNPWLWIILIFGSVAAFIALVSDNKSPG
jgi:hypothetical protein